MNEMPEVQEWKCQQKRRCIYLRQLRQGVDKPPQVVAGGGLGYSFKKEDNYITGLYIK